MGGNRDEHLLVLLAEDDRDIAELTALCLEGEGMTVITAPDGKRALRLLEACRPDVVITDLMMPVSDGFAFLRECRARGHRTPVIAVSAFDGYLDKALDLGADAAYRKPYEVSTLAEAARRLSAGEHIEVARRAAGAPARGEPARLQAILALGLDQPAPEESLGRFVDRIAAHFDVQMALISVITQDRQYWTAGCGIPADLAQERGGPRRDSFCTHAVSARAALVVQDTLENPFFSNNPFVRNRALRFYAGVPLITARSEALGTLCLLDDRPRSFSHYDLELLGVFGRCVLAALERRERHSAADIPLSMQPYLHYMDEELDVFGRAAFYELAIAEGARGAEQEVPVACALLAVPPERLAATVSALRASNTMGLVGRLGRARLGWLVFGMSATEARARALEAGGPGASAAAALVGRYPGAVRSELFDLALALGDAGY